jgi:hypothetical protein
MPAGIFEPPLPDLPPGLGGGGPSFASFAFQPNNTYVDDPGIWPDKVPLEMPPKGSGQGPGGGNSGGGGLPGTFIGPGGGFGGMSGNPYAGYASGSMGANVGSQRRLMGMGYASGGPVAPSDTVPAMLTPGEYVVNAQAASHPLVQQLLQLLNGYACGGPVRGYADGGMVRPTPGIGAMAPTSGGTNYAPITPQANPNTPTYDQWRHQTGWGYGGTPMSGYFRDTVGPQKYNEWLKANYPAQTSGNAFNDPINAYTQLIQQYNQNGSFGPQGSQDYLRSLQGVAANNASALGARAMNAANVYGMDPSQAATTRLQSLMGTDRDAANMLGNVNAQFLQNQDEFGKNLLSQLFGYGANRELSNNSYLHNLLLQNDQQDASKHNFLPNLIQGQLGRIGQTVNSGD